MDELGWHESTRRLLDYARKATLGTKKEVQTPLQLIRRMGITSATFTNWKKRGVSKEGAIKAEELFGCSVQWVMIGEAVAAADEHAMAEADKPLRFRDLDPFEAQYITLFRQLGPDDKHDELVRLNQRVDRAAKGPSAQNPWKGRMDRRQADRREDSPKSSTPVGDAG